uniref:Apple domain-containing protein n=1 Tax=Magallana gigas TaxID=29159 RepID=A0A8W8KUR0_MAGGI
MIWKTLLLIFYLNVFPPNKWGNSLRYQHWAYQRNTRTSLATRSTPITSSSVSKLSECWDLCGATPACSAFSYDENASICFIFENTDDVVNVTKNQKYFVVQTRVQYSDALKQAELFNGHLLRINNYRKQRFVEELNLNSTDLITKYRVDGIYTGGVWKFSNGQRIAEFYWYPGEPAKISTHTSIGLRYTYLGKWDDIVETALHGCICEKEILMQ